MSDTVHTVVGELVAPDDLLLRAGSPDAGDDGRTVVVRLLSWGEPARTPQGLEVFDRQAFDQVDPTQVVIESQAHGGELVGRGTELLNRDDGPYLVARISDTQGGRDMLELLKDRVLSAASATFRPITSRRRPDGVIQRIQADLRKVAILQPNGGAYASAGVVEVRHDMTEQIQEPVVTPAAPQVDLGPVNARMDEIVEQLAAVRQEAAQAPVEERAAFDEINSLAQAWELIAADPSQADELNRALADNTIAANTGLHGQANIGRIVEPVAAKRRTINAVGLAGLPETGMTVDYIRFDDSGSSGYQALVDVQATEKAEINTGTHVWTPDQAGIVTYAGGSDNSWQLLERSSPSFRDLLLRQYASEWAFKTNQAFVTALVAAGTADTLTLGADASALLAKLIDQSVAIEAETDLPASVVLAATDVWSAIAKLPDLMPPSYGTQNVPGTVQASTLSISVSGLTISHEPRLGAGKMITTRGGGEVAEFREDGPRLATQDQVSKLGTDIAVWGLGAHMVYRPAALFVTTVTLA